jgi:hypothetical protein
MSEAQRKFLLAFPMAFILVHICTSAGLYTFTDRSSSLWWDPRLTLSLCAVPYLWLGGLFLFGQRASFPIRTLLWVLVLCVTEFLALYVLFEFVDEYIEIGI